MILSLTLIMVNKRSTNILDMLSWLQQEPINWKSVVLKSSAKPNLGRQGLLMQNVDTLTVSTKNWFRSSTLCTLLGWHGASNSSPYSTMCTLLGLYGASNSSPYSTMCTLLGLYGTSNSSPYSTLCTLLGLHGAFNPSPYSTLCTLLGLSGASNSSPYSTMCTLLGL